MWNPGDDCVEYLLTRVRFLSLVMAAVSLSPRPAAALTINLTFDAATSDAPAFDMNGTLLQPVIREAADRWEDIIHNGGTLDITYYYDDLSDANNTLADHLNLATSGGKPTEARIRFDTQKDGSERNWFFDPTPGNDSEYDLQQTLYRDLSGTNQTNWFNGSPPDLLEVGYRGGLSATAPAAAMGAFDIFSTAIHELGHAVTSHETTSLRRDSRLTAKNRSQWYILQAIALESLA